MLGGHGVRSVSCRKALLGARPAARPSGVGVGVDVDVDFTVSQGTYVPLGLTVGKRDTVVFDRFAFFFLNAKRSGVVVLCPFPTYAINSWGFSSQR